MGILSVFCIYDTIGTDVNIVSKNEANVGYLFFAVK